ncbi:hypothetical protein CSA17_03325 [bacterium DOLJORAL78_65_58]|nr:MAG: hypothetical protein CSB20_09640 [bacterium DOLZORAL124_64_63]PIE76231.1 MAG: hypothetical protein CSA17_03325 [bacterium DOLJORAL78_65_58]
MKNNPMSGAIRRRGLWVLGLVLTLALCGPGVFPAGATAQAARSGVPKVDLNSASLETIKGLPITEEVARSIYDYRTYVRFFGNVYELREVPGVTGEVFKTLKPLVATMPPPEQDASLKRLGNSYRQVRRYMGQEGSNEGLADEYLDRMRSPENINHLDLYDLMSYQNVSPVDATNILKARDRLGRFESSRQLRRSEGLRYWAFRNLRDFVVYDDKELSGENSNDITGFVSTRYHETPMSNDDEELGAFASGAPRGRYHVGEKALYSPGFFNKVTFSSREGVVGGLMTNREYGENKFDETVKAYVGVRDLYAGKGGIKGIYFGSYRVAFGLGLVMDNTDYIHFRKTGYGFNKRMLGVRGDVSRSHEYALRGAAVEARYGRLNATLFVSNDRKDGILNQDGTINRYVVMQPRPPADWLEGRVVGPSVSYLRRDAFTENIIGGNMKLMLAPGTFVGVTGYEAKYSRGWRPDVNTLVFGNNLDLLEGRDTEIWNSYDSVVTEEDGSVTEHKWRRVMGAEAQAVYGNTAVQAEYAFLQDPRNKFFSGDNPDAYIINAFSQWDNLHLLAIWRDYDVGFDNPYNRAFSNDNRYEQTLLDAPYRLNDDLYTWVEANTPQPKPEKGMFLEARYRISRKLILNGLQYDQWQRKSDGADLMRYTIKAEYQPKFNFRVRVRHRYSSRSEANADDVRVYRNWETRWQLITLLSNYNRLGFTYMTSNVMFPARPRLGGTDGSGEGSPAVGTAGMPAHAFEARYEHNLTEGIKLTFASSVYDGFLWNFEGNEFVLLDGNGFRNWLKIESRVSQRLLFQLKVTRDHNLPKTYVDVRRFGEPSGAEPDARYVPVDNTIVRLQMDYTF